MITYPSGTLLGSRVDGNDNVREAALDDYVVTQYNNQSISGTKTFVSNIVNSPAPTSGTHLTNKTYVDAQDSAVSGNLQTDISSRALTTYVDAQDATLSGLITTKADKAYVDTQDAAAVTSGSVALTAASGSLQSSINLKAAISYVDSQDLAISGVLNSRISSVSGNLQTDINTRALKSYVDSQDSTISGLISAKADLSYVNSQDAAAVASGSAALTAASGVLKSYTDTQAAAAVTSGNTALNSASGTLQASINVKADTSYVDSQDLTISGVLNSRITAVSGNLQTDINTRALKSYVDSQDSTISGLISAKADLSYVDTQDAAAVASGTAALTSASGVLRAYTDTQAAAAVTSGNTALLAASGTLQTNINGKVAISGGTMTGFLTLFADPTTSGQAANKFYVDQRDAAISGSLQTQINSKVDSYNVIQTATADITTTSLTYVQIGSFTLTPPSGTYLVEFNASGKNSTGASSNTVGIFNNGTVVGDSERLFASNSDLPISSKTITTVNGSQAIDVRFKVSAGTMTVHARNFIITKL